MRWLWRIADAFVTCLARCFLRAFLIAACIYILLFGSAQAADAIFGSGFESEAEGAPVPDLCANLPVAQPAYASWTQTFSAPDGNPSAAYPESVAFPTPVGAQIGSVRVVPFVPFAGQSVLLYWDQVQARPQDGYGRARPADGMFIAITPCQVNGSGAPDIRPPDPFSSNPFLQPQCRKFESSGALAWTTGNDAACKLEAGRVYYLIVAPINPVTLEPSCKAIQPEQSGCDVGAVTSAGPAQ